METGKHLVRNLLFRPALLMVLFLFSRPAQAAVKLSGVFSDHMVAQREKPFRVWGKAKPGEGIKAAIASQTRETTADGNGNWQVVFEELDLGGPYELKVQGENSLSVKDILAGDVFLCAGQSNMVYPLGRLSDADTIVGAAAGTKGSNQLRLFAVPRALAERPASTCEGHWQAANGEEIRKFSAIAYMFAKQIQEKAKVPVGVIDCSYSGAPIDAWMSPATLSKLDSYRTIFTTRSYMAKVKGNSLAEFNSKIGKADAIDNNNINAGFIGGNGASLVYNGMVAPLLGYSLKAICWYQGEADLGQAQKYSKLFNMLIQDWRKRWGMETDIPFYFVQLPSCALYSDTMGPNAWPAMRAAQADALVLGSTAMIATIDSGDVNSLHPNNKVIVARRLANLVLNRLYGQNVSGLGPKMDSYRSMGRKIVLHFDNVGSGLSLRLKRGITELELADIKGQYFPAQAEVEGSQLTVWSDYVVNPTELRYCWRNSPSATIFNSDNLPAAPFKVDISVRP